MKTTIITLALGLFAGAGFDPASGATISAISDSRVDLGALFLTAPADTLKPAAAKRATRVRSGLEIMVRTETDSNPFRMRESWQRKFDELVAPGSRFAGFESSSDQLLVGRVRGTVSVRTASIREIRIDGGVRYNRFMRNGFGSYVDLDAGLRLGLSKGSHTEVGVEYSPNRFRANYVDPVDSLYRPAHISDLAVTLARRQRLSKKVDVEAGFDAAWRTYDGPFGERDRRVLGGVLGIRTDLSKRGRLRVHAGFQQGSTVDETASVDRSFNQWNASAEFSTRIGDWSPSVETAVRLRHYTTDDDLDFSRFGRKDTRWTVGASLERPVAPSAKAFVGAQYRVKESNRPGDPLDPETVPYSRYRIRVGFTISLGDA